MEAIKGEVGNVTKKNGILTAEEREPTAHGDGT